MAMGSHHNRRARTTEWLTPPELLRALGSFDLDPCAARDRPWSTAKTHLTADDDGLSRPWSGRVWLNPPYGRGMARWFRRLARHGNGVALVFARTETRVFFDWVWPYASGLLFLRGRLRFRDARGCRAPGTGGAPSVLVAYGKKNAAALRRCGLRGAYVEVVERKRKRGGA